MKTYPGAFNTTDWSRVVLAGLEDTPESRAAMEDLCLTYWPPLYAFVRRHGHDETEAKDLTQEFFARFIERNYFRLADRRKGKFRSFLLTCIKHFMAHEREKAQTAKRGGNLKFIPWEKIPQEALADLEPDSQEGPDKTFDRRWAMTLLDQALRRLEEDYKSSRKKDQFEAFKNYLAEQPVKDAYSVFESKLGLSANAAGVALHRFRRRYRELVETEVARTLSDQDELKTELNYLLQLVSH